MAQKRNDERKFNIPSVKPGRRIGFAGAAEELGIIVDTLYGWNKQAKGTNSDLKIGSQTPEPTLRLQRKLRLIKRGSIKIS